TVAPQLGIPVESVEATARCESDARGLLGMSGAAPDLQNIELEIQVTSAAAEADVRRLYQTWQERCPIYLSLVKPTPVKTTLQVKPV
ncbi:MAG TPA: OsmC family protein, partial [Candidatus Limnocylindria bacterium]|nr:OsmC family protein [Candidatus Limnocylindria bacterium]